MRKFKAIVSIILIVLMLCGGGYLVYFFSRDSKHNKVITTIFPIYDICREILGDEEDIMLLQDNGVDMHSYQPTAMDIASISKAELLVCIGGESDKRWLDNVIKSTNNNSLNTLKLIETIDALEESMDGIINGEHVHEHDTESVHTDHVAYDEHIWLSIRNMKKMTKEILEKLIVVYPHREILLRTNAEKYISELDRLDTEYTNVCSEQTSTIIMADRFPFLYLANDYKLDFLAAYHGCSADVGVTPSTIVALRNKVNEEELNYLCVLETSDKAIANAVINDSSCRDGVTHVVLNSCQTVSNKDIHKLSYISIMESNLINLRRVITNEVNRV